MRKKGYHLRPQLCYKYTQTDRQTDRQTDGRTYAYTYTRMDRQTNEGNHGRMHTDALMIGRKTSSTTATML